ncbi:tRNA lysidine(34) synthetase TilS [Buchnera aphidicola]|uniref:tRNA lysidine(34) synthetase TilS n=1 Tax=Buchnera aphidicola TaxID=9 RepID=UPI003464D5B6
MIKKFKKILNKNKKFLLAYSGGIDSTALLIKLINWKKKKNKNLQLRAIHINHNLQKKSKIWEKHCKKICIKYKIPLIIKNIFIQKTKLGIEGQARKQRYKIFKKNILKNEILLTAHNLNDQCETFFLALKRGSGLNGLSGIAYKKKFYKSFLIRPLLNCTRKKIKKYIKKKKICWINDDSNENIKYERNFIRKKILPKFTNKWKFFLKNCLKSIKIIKKNKSIIKKYNNKIIKKNLIFKNCLNLKKIIKLNQFIFVSIIYQWIKNHKIKFYNYKIIKKIYFFIKKKKKKIYKIEIKKYVYLIIYKKKIYIQKRNVKNIKKLIIFWHNPKKKLIFPYSLGKVKLTKKKTKKSIKIFLNKKKLLNFRFYIKGKFLINKKKKKIKIKKIWQLLKINIIERKHSPFLFSNNTFIGALNYFSIKKKNILKKKKKKYYIKYKK